MSHPVLSVNDLSVSFHGAPRPVIRNISFEVFAGKTTALVGESGSGKSLTSLAIMGLLPPNGKIESGGIQLFEGDQKTPLHALTERDLQALRGRRMGMIFQEPMTALNPSTTCGAQVSEVLEQHSKLSKKECEKRVLEVFKKVKLPNPQQAFEKYPHELSGGQRQRVVIAMAIICKPLLLIADEPTTALDVTVQKEILNLLRELQESEGMGMIFITHDLGVVSEIADDVVVLFRGDIVERGSIQQILKSPKEPYTKGLIASRPPDSGKPKRLPTVSDFLEGNPPSVESSIPFAVDPSETPLLEVQEIGVRYRVSGGYNPQFFEAVKGVSLKVYKGQTIGLVGESGCGKSTLGRAVIGLTSPFKGRIKFRGQDILTLSKKGKRDLTSSIQLIFQDPFSSLNPKRTIGQTLLEPMVVHRMYDSKKRSERVSYLLERVGLSPQDISKYPHEFSGGQRQRIGIARALTLEPELIICDESVSALDVSVQAQVINLLNDLKEEFGFSYIFISHDLSVVRYMSDQIAVMQSGEIVEDGEADNVYHHPKEAYTQKLINSIPKYGY
ncbi:MAG: ABC transporter ATP-binding protein [Schleiferiaceae bacterium]